MKISQPVLTGLPLFLCSAALSAETPYRNPDPIVVTASRTEQHQSEALSSTIVIDRQEIERLQATSVSDLLRGRAGIAFANNGGPGKSTTFFLRGTNSDQTLFLIDGVRFSSATTAAAAIHDIPIEQIERIEIVKGPRSSLYGSEAIGGVIQIFTRSGKGTRGVRPTFSATAGSNNTTRFTGGLSAADENGWVNVNLSRFNTHGFDTCGGFVDSRFQCSSPTDLDDDGYENQSFNMRAGYRLSDRVEADFAFFQTLGENEFDPGDSFSEAKQQVVSGRIKLTPLDFWDTSLQVARSKDELDSFSNFGTLSRINTDRHSVLLQNNFTLASRQLLTVGLDYYEDQVETNNAMDGLSRYNVAGFAQYQGHWGAHHFKASARLDDNEQFGSEPTGDVAYGYDLMNNLTLRASYGTAFKAPSFNDLYFPGFGNPDLDPESSRSFEIGLDGWHGPVNWSLSAYQTDIDDLIVIVPSPATLFGIQPQNVREARIRGIEGSVSMTLDDWLFRAQADWMDPEIRGNEPDAGNILPRRHQQSLRLDIDRQFHRFSLGASWQLVSRRFDDTANQTRLSGYGVLDFRGQYRLSRNWTVQALLSNVLDKEYQTAFGFDQPDREFLLTVRYQPQY